jgi:GNAT superfamily N-acetyltransferase
MISFQVEKNISLEEYIFILNDSGLGARRPMHDPDHLRQMIEGSNFLVTARDKNQLVGLLRGLSDFCYRCFIADLAVAKSYQRKGVGREILQFARGLAPDARLILFAAEDAELFYQKLGFKLHEHCYQLKPEDFLG